MSPRGGQFNDSFDDLLKQAAGMSDSDLARAMGFERPEAETAGTPPVEALEPGTRVQGVVVDVRQGEVLVELDGKTLGVIDEAEFEDGGLPAIGERIQVAFERHDPAKGFAVLSAGGVRRQLYWEEVRPGTLLEGTVTSVNKGGLTLDVKGRRAFLPASHVELERVDDLSPYVGRKLRCEVTLFDPEAGNLVLSRRAILERQKEAERSRALAGLGEGEILTGTVARINDHGAFVDLGGLDGLLPAGRIRQHLMQKTLTEPLREGQEIEVQVIKVDRGRQRVSLDLRTAGADTWGRAIEHYAVGEEVTGWVSRQTGAGAVVALEEGIEGLLPEECFHRLEEAPRPGAIVKAAIASIDRARKQVILKPPSRDRE